MLNVFKSEWIKFSSQPLSLLGAVGTIIIAPIAFTMMIIINNPNQVIMESREIVAFGLQSLMLSQVGIVIMASSYWGAEYEHATLRTTFLSISSRKQVISVKFILLSVITILAGVTSFILIWILSTIAYEEPLSSFLYNEYMTRIILFLISWLQISWICSGLTVISKSKILTISIMFPLFLGLSRMMYLITPLVKYLPDLATINVFSIVEITSFLSIRNGLLVQTTWAIISLCIATLLIIHRDTR